MNVSSPCVVCLNRDGFECRSWMIGGFDGNVFECDVCGRYKVSRTALVDVLRADDNRLEFRQRAALSHFMRLQADADRDNEMWTTGRLDRFFESGAELPVPSQQVTNLIRLIGDAIAQSGEPLAKLPRSLAARIGSMSYSFATSLISDMIEAGLVKAHIFRALAGPIAVNDISLTLAGWDRYERERQGQISGNYGFIALKFGDSILDPLLRDHIKPAIKTLGFDLLDLRDVAQAGIIDNLLRIQIRDAAFVIVDLTHENAGAYWEAGYAEGLGKPVLYICEKSKFDEKKTHFDTNHCTTVLWNVEILDNFKEELVATLRRSLVI